MSRRQLTKEFCESMARTCINRNDFQKKDCAAYKKAFKEGWIENWFPKFFQPERKWTKKSLHEEALKYPSKNSFKWGNWNAYHAARRKPYFDEICSHMKTISASDKNVLYLLKATIKNQTLYKVGITSQRCKNRRKAELKYASQFDFEVIKWIHTPDALTLEKTLLSMGTKPDTDKFRGYTEMRLFSEEELNTIVDLINQAGGV